MILDLDEPVAQLLLGAARSVATAGGSAPLSDRAAGAIASLASLALGAGPPDLGADDPVDPVTLASALDDDDRAATAAELLGVVALVDGSLDRGRIDQVAGFAGAMGVQDHWLADLVQSLEPDLGPVIADMGDRNLRSVTDGRLGVAEIGDVDAWLLPYGGDGADPDLAARYRALGDGHEGTLGHAFWSFYDRHGFAFPGEPGAVNEVFGTPHDTTHVLSGYDTSPQGELLVSTFTSRMHPIHPMEGHVLPVIYSWHLGIEFNKLAGSYRGALDAPKFWVAWERGLRTTGDAFAEGFRFWDHVSEPIDGVREAFGIPALDPAHAAHSTARPGIDYHPIA